MTAKTETKDEITVDEAQAIVDRENEAKKDGVAIARPDNGAGVMLEPDKTDRSILTYSGENPTKIEKPKPEKSPYTSGEPVSDRS